MHDVDKLVLKYDILRKKVLYILLKKNDALIFWKYFYLKKKKKKKKNKSFHTDFSKYIKSKAFYCFIYLLIIINKNYLFQFKWNTVYINKKKKNLV